MHPTLSHLVPHPDADSCDEPEPPRGWKSKTTGNGVFPVYPVGTCTMNDRDAPLDMMVCVLSPALTVPGHVPPSPAPPELPPLELPPLALLPLELPLLDVPLLELRPPELPELLPAPELLLPPPELLLAPELLVPELPEPEFEPVPTPPEAEPLELEPPAPELLELDPAPEPLEFDVPELELPELERPEPELLEPEPPLLLVLPFEPLDPFGPPASLSEPLSDWPHSDTQSAHAPRRTHFTAEPRGRIALITYLHSRRNSRIPNLGLHHPA